MLLGFLFFSLDIWLNVSFDFQVWEEYDSGLFPRLRSRGVAPTGGLGSGPRWGSTLWNAFTAGGRAPTHQAGTWLPRQSPLLPLHDLRHEGFSCQGSGKTMPNTHLGWATVQRLLTFKGYLTKNCVGASMVCPHSPKCSISAGCWNEPHLSVMCSRLSSFKVHYV